MVIFGVKNLILTKKVYPYKIFFLRISGYPDIRISEYPDIEISEQITERTRKYYKKKFINYDTKHRKFFR
jgi:hypothetical protein